MPARIAYVIIVLTDRSSDLKNIQNMHRKCVWIHERKLNPCKRTSLNYTSATAERKIGARI